MFIPEITDLDFIIKFCTTFLIVGLVIQLVSRINLQRKEIESLIIDSLYFKRQNYIRVHESVKVKDDCSLLILGNDNAPNTISLYISPSCPHCRETTKEILALMENERTLFKLNVVLGEGMKGDNAKIMSWIYYYRADKHMFEMQLKEWAHNRHSILNRIKDEISNDNELLESYKHFQKFLDINSINSFPRFALNGRVLSRKYHIMDLEYLVIDDNK